MRLNKLNLKKVIYSLFCKNNKNAQHFCKCVEVLPAECISHCSLLSLLIFLHCSHVCLAINLSKCKILLHYIFIVCVSLDFYVLFLISGIIFSITIPALYSKYQEHVDRYAGLMHTKISKHYSVVDENVRKRIPKGFSRDKDN